MTKTTTTVHDIASPWWGLSRPVAPLSGAR
ncbi:type IV toxin-antitoxin system YeeU family antitoxin, partial [Salmonella enterica subsp. enterica serovar Newport]|nr:type IV toxin-antitoxin system YeeU family antitoxin [Salmonella enterica subsp. enterica serovar Newport]